MGRHAVRLGKGTHRQVDTHAGSQTPSTHDHDHTFRHAQNSCNRSTRQTDTVKHVVSMITQVDTHRQAGVYTQQLSKTVTHTHIHTHARTHAHTHTHTHTHTTVVIHSDRKQSYNHRKITKQDLRKYRNTENR